MRQTPVTYLQQVSLSLSTYLLTIPNTYIGLPIFNDFSSINQISFLPGYISSVWSELNLGSTIYASTLVSPYAVIVGPDNIVGGIYTLTAGISNTNYGSNALVGGYNCYVSDANVIAYGTNAQAISTNAAAFGISTLATGQNSIVYGLSSQTVMGSNQHVHGISNIAYGTASHTEGLDTIVYSDFSHIEGFNTQIWGGTNSHAEGTSTFISTGFGIAIHVEGLSTFVYGDTHSHAEGANTIANIGLAHAEGEATFALGSTVHAEGFQNIVSTFLSTAIFSSIVGFTSNVPGSNSHIEGMCNILFMPNSHIEGYSTINYGWVSHLEGIQNRNQGGVIQYIIGSNNLMEGPLIYNNSTFIKSFSSLLALRTYNCCIITGLNNISYQYSVFNHLEGINQYVSSPTFMCHVEGNSNRVCATETHIEGARNFAFFSQDRRTLNIAVGEGTHLEGFCNAVSSPTWNIHIEGASNRFNVIDNIRDTNATHFGGCGHSLAILVVDIVPGISQTRGLHTEGSNLTTVPVAGYIFAVTSIHKEGINNTAKYFANCDLNAICGQANSGNRTGITGGLSNVGGGNAGGMSATFGSFNENANDSGNITILGTSNFINFGATHSATALGNYTSNALLGSLTYGTSAFFHSTPNSRLIRGSAQSIDLTLRAITSSSAYVYSNFIYMGNRNYNNGTLLTSSITFNTVTNSFVNYPASNQMVYLHNVDLKLTGYQTRTPDSSGGFGFYSGTYSFVVYRDNTQQSNLYLFDISSQSSISTNVVSLTPISTTVKPITETNRLFNTSEVNLLLYARNTAITLPQTALYGLQINTNGNIITNWTAEMEISQLMRP